MKDVMEYKDFIGSVRYSAVDDICYGKLEGIEELIVFEGDSVKELNSAFKRAVEDYQDHVKKLANRDTSHTRKVLLSG
jgi:predicted HicB family RNase H-like nuclease